MIVLQQFEHYHSLRTHQSLSHYQHSLDYHYKSKSVIVGTWRLPRLVSKSMTTPLMVAHGVKNFKKSVACHNPSVKSCDGNKCNSTNFEERNSACGCQETAYKRPPSAAGIPVTKDEQSLSLFFDAELFVVVEVLPKLHPPEKEGPRLLDHL